MSQEPLLFSFIRENLKHTQTAYENPLYELNFSYHTQPNQTRGTQEKLSGTQHLLPEPPHRSPAPPPPTASLAAEMTCCNLTTRCA